MFKLAAAGMTALFVAASPFAYAQNQSGNAQDHPNAGQAGEPSDVTDLRIETIKSALQLTPSQEQYWPPIEQAIRARAQHRAARLENFAARVSEQQDNSPLETALNRNPVDFMNRRADILAQRAGDLKKLAGAWQPLYAVLSPDQKRRLGLLRIYAFRTVMSRLGGRSGQFYDYDEDYDEE